MKIVRLVLVGAVCLVLAAFGAAAVLWMVVNKTNGELESSGLTRKYLTHVPASYDPARPAPLVISIHGFAEWPAHQAEISGWNALADEQGFIVVYPLGTQLPLRWNAYELPDAKVSSSQEVRFISDLIDKLSGEYNIDPGRIYANGLSNGGGMSVLLGCRLADRLAAIGSVAGAYLLSPDRCVPSRPIPIIAFHGTKDPIVPFEGGKDSRWGKTFPAIPAWVATWVQRNGCDTAPQQLPARGEVSGVEYTRCAGIADVDFYTVAGGGHSWPGGGELPEPFVGHTTHDIDATRVMWDFFSRHTLQKP